jgi:hypothetical protein
LLAFFSDINQFRRCPAQASEAAITTGVLGMNDLDTGECDQPYLLTRALNAAEECGPQRYS